MGYHAIVGALPCSSFGKIWVKKGNRAHLYLWSASPSSAQSPQGAAGFVYPCQGCSWPCRKSPCVTQEEHHSCTTCIPPAQILLVLPFHYLFSGHDSAFSFQFLCHLWHKSLSRIFASLIRWPKCLHSAHYPQQLVNKTPPIGYNFFLSSFCIASLESNSICSSPEYWKKKYFFLLAVFLWVSHSWFTAVLPPA